MTIEDGIKSLIDRAQKHGYIAYDDINGTFSDKLFSADELDEVYFRLRNLGIEIVDQTDHTNDSQI